jgi:hypothetical protein
VIYYPESLPAVRASGFSAQYKDPVIRTQMDAGPAKQRLRYTATTKQFTGSVVCNEEERAIFEDWFVRTLGYGTLRFIMRNPETGDMEEFRFAKAYSETETDGHFEIAVSLERLP